MRAFYPDWYGKLVDALPPLKDGYITAPQGPGLGLELSSEIDKRFTVTRRKTTLQ